MRLCLEVNESGLVGLVRLCLEVDETVSRFGEAVFGG